MKLIMKLIIQLTIDGLKLNELIDGLINELTMKL